MITVPTRPQNKHLKPFQKGADPRRNTKGRPKSFDDLRKLARQIAHEDAKAKGGGKLEINGHIASVTEAILRQWFASSDPRLQMRAMEIAFGKVPDRTEISGKDGGPVNIQMTWGDHDSSAGATED